MSQTTWFYKDMLAELFSRVWESRCLTMSDRWGLSRALLSCSLDLEDLAAIDRIVHAVRRGWLSCANQFGNGLSNNGLSNNGLSNQFAPELLDIQLACVPGYLTLHHLPLEYVASRYLAFRYNGLAQFFQNFFKILNSLSNYQQSCRHSDDSWASLGKFSHPVFHSAWFGSDFGHLFGGVLDRLLAIAESPVTNPQTTTGGSRPLAIGNRLGFANDLATVALVLA